MPSKYYPTSRTIHPPHLIAKESVISPHGHINKLPLPHCTVLHTFLVLLVLFVHQLYLGPTSSNNQPTHHVLYTTHTVPVTVMMKAHNLHMHMLHMLRSKHWNVYSNRDDMWWQLRDKVKEFAIDWTATKWLWELSNHNIPTNNAANHAVLKLVPIVTDKRVQITVTMHQSSAHENFLSHRPPIYVRLMFVQCFTRDWNTKNHIDHRLVRKWKINSLQPEWHSWFSSRDKVQPSVHKHI